MGVRSTTGHLSWISVSTNPLYKSGEERPYAVVISFSDITEQKRGEDALRESRQKYKQLFESNVAAFALHEMICDSDGAPVDYRFLEVNPAFEQMTGLKAADLVGRTILQAMPNTELHWIERYGRVALTGESIHFEEYSGELDRYYDVTAYSPRKGQFAVMFLDITQRKKMEQQLRASEETFSRAFHSGALMMTISDLETGEYLVVNDTFTRISGFSREEAVGKTSVALGWISAPDRQRLKEEMRERGRVSGMELTLRHKNGTAVPCLYFGEMITIHGQKRLLSIAEDITERKKVEQQLLASERRFREVLENVNLIAVELDRSGAITFCNDFLLSLTGWSRSELLGQNWFERFIPPSDQKRMREIHAGNLLAKTEYLHFENPILTRTGECRYIAWDNTQQWSADGKVTGVVSLGADITDRKLSEQALRESESKYRALFDNSPVGIILLRKPAEVLAANSSFCRIVGRSLEELHKNSVLICYTDPQDHQLLLELLERQNVVYNRELSGQRPDGRHFWCRANAMKLPELGPDVLLGVIEDITEQKNIEEELLQRRAELAHANRLSTIGEMASCLAHELNQPLTGISILAGGCLRSVESTRTVSQNLIDALEEIITQTAQAGKVINSIKHFIRKDDPQRRELDINAVIQDAVQLITPECLTQKVTLRVCLAEALPPVWADPTQIEQVIVNLVHNGIEAMEHTPPPRKTIQIESHLRDSGFVEIRISDRGCGIPAELESKIFESFYTTKSKGVGLGLPLCRSIVEAHGGKIGMTPNPDPGVTFHFTLPLLQRENEP